MKHLIIYANPSKSGFNSSILEELQKTIIIHSSEYEVRDLYDMNFQPVLSKKELENLKFDLSAPDVLMEQGFINRANIIHFIYPIWWTGMPAILKGYIDRVYSYGFSYKREIDGVKGLLTEKKVFIYNTLGQSREEYENEMFKALTLTSDVGIFNFCGMEVIRHFYFPSIKAVSNEVRNNYLAGVKTAIDKLYKSQQITI